MSPRRRFSSPGEGWRGSAVTPPSRRGCTAWPAAAAQTRPAGREPGRGLAAHAEADAIQVAPGDPAGRKTALAILAAAGRLAMPQRQAVLMRDVQGLSYDEIAAVQDVPVGTVRSRIAAARRSIADEVGEA